jgi:hypothetical protein
LAPFNNLNRIDASADSLQHDDPETREGCMTDERLQIIVMDELQWDPRLDASEIGVLVEGVMS